MKKHLIILLTLTISLFSCKEKKSSKINSSLVKESTKLEKKSVCIKISDSINVKNFVEGFIADIENDNKKEFSERFSYPITLFSFKLENNESFIKKWNGEEELNKFFSLDQYDEDDELIGKSNKYNTKIHYIEDSDGCFIAQFGIGSGLIFNIKKIKENLKIVRLDIAG